MRALLVPALWLVVIGFPPSWLATRSVALALVVSPLVAALVCSVAAMVAIVTHTSLVLWVVVLLVAVNAALIMRPPRFRSPLPAWPVAVVAVATAPLLLMARESPFEWDARSIWWFHAEWLRAGGAQAAHALGDPLLSWSHPDYPPLISATVAMIWRLTGDRPDPKVALMVTILVTWSAMVSFGVAILWALHRAASARPRLAPLIAGLAGLAALAALGYTSLAAGAGYVDHLWSAWFAAAAVLLLLAPGDRDTTLLGVVLLAGAMLTKNEAMAAGLGLVVLAAIRHRRRGWVAIAPLAVPVALVLTWTGIAHALGARSDLLQGGRFAELLRGDPKVLGGFRFTEVWLRGLMQGTVIAALVVSVLGAFARPHLRRRTGLGSDLWLWVWLVGDVAVLVVTYLISPYEPGWLLVTSAGRTTLAPLMVLIAILTVGATLALLRDPLPLAEPLAGAVEAPAVHT